ncbi:GPW/gp25 family protein [Helicobacter cappadocius]|uniref:GPW/gp25 family protein n=1 Tax=Helicobacter cappadocius TaxID=3063998 RepID=A0AA90TCK4_9HELI|nr:MULTISPECIES: GPW/gp25 family protein [unclassified Helicobacter]MDO7253905.1 GPW/gp25 family protein [Helicobacter sp. faydin-H75]MDP2539766.1 GPW/gp25 family protein [Helicobacter sp. faydin-H76]
MSYKLSIQANLNRIFKTKKYSIPLNPNFGLSYEWIDRAFTQDLEMEIINQIQEQIKLFEPRLKMQSIRVIKNEDRLEVFINTDFRIIL